MCRKDKPCTIVQSQGKFFLKIASGLFVKLILGSGRANPSPLPNLDISLHNSDLPDASLSFNEWLE